MVAQRDLECGVRPEQGRFQIGSTWGCSSRPKALSAPAGDDWLCARIPANCSSSLARTGAVISRHEQWSCFALDILRLESRLIRCSDAVFPTRRSASRLRSELGRAFHERGAANPIVPKPFHDQTSLHLCTPCVSGTVLPASHSELWTISVRTSRPGIGPTTDVQIRRHAYRSLPCIR